MVEVHSIVTMRKFNITLDEKEFAALIDMINWNDEIIDDHMALNYFDTYGNQNDAIEEVIKIRDKFMDIINEE